MPIHVLFTCVIFSFLQEKEKKSKQHSLKRPKLVYVHDKKYIKKLPKSNFRKVWDTNYRGVLFLIKKLKPKFLCNGAYDI